MQLKRLSLTNVRVFEQAEFDFQPGMNLLVGVNGAGKSTVLDVLRIMFSQTLPQFTPALKKTSIPFDKNDIAIGQNALTAKLQFETSGISFEHLVHLPREEYAIDSAKEGQVRDQTYDLIEHNILTPNEVGTFRFLQRKSEQPLVVYFSPHRSLPNMQADKELKTAKPQASAYIQALVNDRGLHLRDIAQWWLVQEALSSETNDSRRYLRVLSDTVSTFLDGCTNLRAVRDPATTLLIDKGSTTLDARQLSDGERSILALVLDLAQRLAKANPDVEDPLTEGRAIVLIDEIDLHLHPKWQREIAEKLTRTFPNCQFIATTHSPQILGEVPARNITLLEHGQAPYHPSQSLGMDSNWILQFLMGDADRNKAVAQKLEDIGDLIGEEHYEQAQSAIDALREEIGDFPDLVRLQTRLERLQILGV